MSKKYASLIESLHGIRRRHAPCTSALVVEHRCTGGGVFSRARNAVAVRVLLKDRTGREQEASAIHFLPLQELHRPHTSILKQLQARCMCVWCMCAVHDVFAVLHRGRPNAEAKASYDDRDKSFDNMKYSRMLKLNRAAKRIQATWAGEANNDMEDHTHAEMLDFTMDELEAVAAQLNENEPEEWHPAAAFAVDLDEDDDPDAGNAVNADVGVEGEIANNDEMAAMLMEADQVGQGDAPEDEDDRARLGDINMQMGGMGLEEADDDGIDDQA